MIDFLIFIILIVVVYCLSEATLSLVAIVLNCLEWIINKLRGWN